MHHRYMVQTPAQTCWGGGRPADKGIAILTWDAVLPTQNENSQWEAVLSLAALLPWNMAPLGYISNHDDNLLNFANSKEHILGGAGNASPSARRPKVWWSMHC